MTTLEKEEIVKKANDDIVYYNENFDLVSACKIDLGIDLSQEELIFICDNYEVSGSGKYDYVVRLAGRFYRIEWCYYDYGIYRAYAQPYEVEKKQTVIYRWVKKEK